MSALKLQLAVKAGDAAAVAEVLPYCSQDDIDRADKEDDTVLHHAILGGHVDIVKMLARVVSKEVLVGKRLSGRLSHMRLLPDNYIPLYYAAKLGQAHSIRALLSRHKDEQLATWYMDGSDALGYAVLSGNLDSVAALAEQCSQDSIDCALRDVVRWAIEEPPTTQGMYPFIRQENVRPIIETLLSHGGMYYLKKKALEKLTAEDVTSHEKGVAFVRPIIKELVQRARVPEILNAVVVDLVNTLRH